MGLMQGIKNRVDLTPGQYRPNIIRTGAVAVALTSIFLYILYTKPSVPFLSGGGKKVQVDFAFGANVRPGYTPVRVNGVEVGQVTKIVRRPEGRGARLTLDIKKGSGVKLKQDVRMNLRWRTLLGRNLYVDIDQGSPSAPDFKGGIIPESRTQDQVELDTTLEPFDKRGRQSVQGVIAGFDEGFSDPNAVRGAVSAGGDSMVGGKALGALRGEHPTAVRSAVGAGGKSLKAGAKGLPGLRGQNAGDLPKLVRNTNDALTQLSKDENALGGLVTGGAVALGVTSARRADVASTLNMAPATLQQTRTTLTRLVGTLDEVDPLADELRPGLKELPTAARNTSRALDVARPLLSDLRPTLALLRPALTDLRSASNAGIPAFGPLNHTMEMAEKDFIPFLKAKDPATHRPNYQNIGPFVASGGSAISWGDKNGAWANFEATAGDGVINSPCAIGISNPQIPDDKKIACELDAAALAAALTGRLPQNIKIINPSVPMSKLTPYLSGKKSLVGDLLTTMKRNR